MSQKEEFKPGDLVFAKVKGYPHWPGRIEGPDPQFPVTKARPYLVFFFGTHEVSLCTAKDVISYTDNREKLGAPKRMRGYNEGLWEIQNCPTISRDEPIGGKDRIPPVEEVDGKLVVVASLNESVEEAQEAVETPQSEKKETKTYQRKSKRVETGDKPEVSETPEPSGTAEETPPTQTTRSGRVTKKIKYETDEENKKTPKTAGKRAGSLRTPASATTPARQSARMRIVREEPPLEAEAPDKLPEAAEEKLVETVEVSESNETVEKREATQKSTVSEDTGTTEDTTPSAPNDMEALKARQADLYDDETGSADEVQREYSSPPPLADRHLSRRNGGRKAAEAVMPEKPKKKWEKLRNLSVSEKPTVEAEGKSETATPSEVKRRGRPKRPSPVESATEDEVMTSPQQQPKKKADSPIPEDPEISVVRSTTPTKEMNSGDQQEALDHVKSLVRVELEIKQSLLIGHFNFPRCISVLETFKTRLDSGEVTKDSLVRIPSLVDTLRKCRKFTSCRDIRKLATDIVLILTHMFVDPNLNPDAQLESPTSGEELWFKNFKKESEKFLKENKEWAQLLKERLASGGGGSRRRSLNTYESQKLSSPPPAKRARVEEESPPAAVQAVPASQSVMVGVENQPEVSLPVESAENTPEERGDLSLDTANNSGQSGSAPDEDVVLPDVKESEESSIAAAQQLQVVDNPAAQQPPLLQVSPGSALASGGTSRPSSVSPALPLQPINMGTMRKDICDVDFE